MGTHSYKESQVWQKSIDLLDTVYNATVRFPKQECTGLGLQMQKASVSLASTIAEASSREDANELLQFMGSASGELTRLKTQMIIAEHGKFLDRECYAKLHEMCNDLSIMIRNLLQPQTKAPAQEPQYEPS